MNLIGGQEESLVGCYCIQTPDACHSQNHPESKIRKQKGHEWDARVKVFREVTHRIAWDNPETVLLLANKRAFAKILDNEIKVMLCKAKQAGTKSRTEDIVCSITILPVHLLISACHEQGHLEQLSKEVIVCTVLALVLR